jgi:hypothetical protein
MSMRRQQEGVKNLDAFENFVSTPSDGQECKIQKKIWHRTRRQRFRQRSKHNQATSQPQAARFVDHVNKAFMNRQ